VERSELDSSGSGYGTVAGPYEHGAERTTGTTSPYL